MFEAWSKSGTNSDKNLLLSQLVIKAKSSGLKVDQSALAFKQQGRIRFYGDTNLVKYLSNKGGVPQGTHKLSA